jgi:hypothetical protein
LCSCWDSFSLEADGTLPPLVTAVTAFVAVRWPSSTSTAFGVSRAFPPTRIRGAPGSPAGASPRGCRRSCGRARSHRGGAFVNGGVMAAVIAVSACRPLDWTLKRVRQHRQATAARLVAGSKSAGMGPMTQRPAAKGLLSSVFTIRPGCAGPRQSWATRSRLPPP